jgi:hypothetical protein
MEGLDSPKIEKLNFLKNESVKELEGRLVSIYQRITQITALSENMPEHEKVQAEKELDALRKLMDGIDREIENREENKAA